MLEQGVKFGAMSVPKVFQTFESNILYSLRFMIDCNITGGQWVTLPEGCYYRDLDKRKKLTHCQYEVHTHFSNIESHPPEGGLTLACQPCSPCTSLSQGLPALGAPQADTGCGMFPEWKATVTWVRAQKLFLRAGVVCEMDHKAEKHPNTLHLPMTHNGDLLSTLTSLMQVNG